MPSITPFPTSVLTVVEPAIMVAPFYASQQRALIDRWRTWLREQESQAQLAPATLRLYEQGGRAWIAFIETVAGTDRPTSATVGAFLAAVIPTRKPGSANALLSATKSLYRWSASVDAYADIARPIRPVRVDRDGPLPCLGHDEVGRLVALIAGDGLTALRDRALILVLYSTACRCISLHRADVAHLDLVAGRLTHRPKGFRGHSATAYLSPSAARACAEYLAERHHRVPFDPDAPLWIATDRRCFGARLGTRSIRGMVVQLMVKAGHARRGVDGRLVAPGIYSAHSIRRSAVTTAAEGHGLDAAQALAGHASATTTRRSYYRSKQDRTLRKVAMTLDLPIVPTSVGQ